MSTLMSRESTDSIYLDESTSVTVRLKVPKGGVPGQTVEFKRANSNTSVWLTLPEGARPGQRMSVRVRRPLPSAPSSPQQNADVRKRGSLDPYSGVPDAAAAPPAAPTPAAPPPEPAAPTPEAAKAAAPRRPPRLLRAQLSFVGDKTTDEKLEEVENALALGFISEEEAFDSRKAINIEARSYSCASSYY